LDEKKEVNVYRRGVIKKGSVNVNGRNDRVIKNSVMDLDSKEKFREM